MRFFSAQRFSYEFDTGNSARAQRESGFLNGLHRRQYLTACYRQIVSKRVPVKVKRVDECSTMHELFMHCLPAFGGAYLRRIYSILDRAIGMGCPLTVSIAGPVTVSGQHLAWLI